MTPAQTWRTFVAAVLPVALAAACQSSPATTQGPVAASPSFGGSTPASSVTVGGDVEIGPGAFFLADPRIGLDGLTAYTATLTLSFDGTANGQAQKWSKTSTLRHTAQPAASVLSFAVTGDAPPAEPALVADQAGASYEVGADGVCSAQPFDAANSAVAWRDPTGLLPTLLGATEAGAEVSNGVAAAHYTFDERALLEAGGPHTSGELWVATEGGHVLKLVRTTTADAGYFGGGLDGTMAWDYELTDIDSTAAVALPDGCQLDVPIMADAGNPLILARYAGFDTHSSVSDVFAYYQDELRARGWSLKSEPVTSADRGFGEFAKGDLVLNLLVTPGENGRRVDLALSSG